VFARCCSLGDALIRFLVSVEKSADIEDATKRAMMVRGGVRLAELLRCCP
jgi:hypothetical protein